MCESIRAEVGGTMEATLNFGDIQKMWREDAPIDSEALDKESLKIPQLFSKYIEILSVKKFQLDRMESEKRSLRRLRYLYYRGALDMGELKKHGWEPWQMSLSKTAEIQNCLDGDEILEEMEMKISYLRMQVSFLENVVKMISSRSFQIRDSISWTKFVNGSD